MKIAFAAVTVGTLLSVLLASLFTARQRANDATRISDIQHVGIALEAYFDAEQAYPENETGVPNMRALDGAHVRSRLSPKYMKQLPTDPSTLTRSPASHYLYEGLNAAGMDCSSLGGCIGYALGATLERVDNAALSTDRGDAIHTGAFFGLGAESCDASAMVGINGMTESCYSSIP